MRLPKAIIVKLVLDKETGKLQYHISLTPKARRIVKLIHKGSKRVKKKNVKRFKKMMEVD